MKSLKAIGLALAVVFIAAGVASAGEDALKGNAQTTCPVMGGQIDKAVYADHDGKRVYFCCPGCVKTFEGDPEKYIKQMEKKGVTLEKAPTGKETEKKDPHHGHKH